MSDGHSTCGPYVKRIKRNPIKREIKVQAKDPSTAADIRNLLKQECQDLEGIKEEKYQNWEGIKEEKYQNWEGIKEEKYQDLESKKEPVGSNSSDSKAFLESKKFIVKRDGVVHKWELFPPVGIHKDEEDEYANDDAEEEENTSDAEEEETSEETEGEAIVFEEDESMRLDMEYEMYSKKRWGNLDALRDNVRETEWSWLDGKHPNYQFIYECKRSRHEILEWLFVAVERVGHSSILDRESWDNIDYLPGGPLLCSKETLDNPRKSRPMKPNTIAHIKVAIEAVITLIYWNVYMTKRSIFYQHFKPLNIDQRRSDRLLDDVACGLRVPRPLIHVLAASKGLIFGDVTLYQHQGKFDIPEGTSIDQIMTGWWTPNDWERNDIRVINCRSGEHVPNKVCKIVDIRSSAKFLLVVEKEATYQTLAESEFASEWKCIMITAKGMPDRNTRHLVRLIWSFLQIPVLALVDGDPYGLDIYCQYKYGSVRMAYDSLNLTVPNMKLIGLRPSDFTLCPFNHHSFQPLSHRDMNKIQELCQRPYTDSDHDLLIELHLFQRYRKKIQLQAFNVIAIDYLCREFLPKRIVTGRFLHRALLGRG